MSISYEIWFQLSTPPQYHRASECSLYPAILGFLGKELGQLLFKLGTGTLNSDVWANIWIHGAFGTHNIGRIEPEHPKHGP